MLRSALVGLAVGIAVFAAAGAVLIASGWSETRVVTGDVNTALNPELLHICEGDGNGCYQSGNSDDSGGDEITYEMDESLLPGGSVKTVELLLFNTSQALPEVGVPWELDAVNVSIIETTDPGGDCDALPTLDIRIAHDADDIDLGTTPQGWPALQDYNNGHFYRMHVEPLSRAQVLLTVSIPSDFPGECQGGHWGLHIDWAVQIV